MTRLSLAFVIPLLFVGCKTPQPKDILPSETFKQYTDQIEKLQIDNEELQRKNVWMKRQLDSIRALINQ